MKKNVIGMALHFCILLALLICVGVFTGKSEEGSGSEKFTGELERGAVIRVLENDTAIKQGYLDELLEAFNEAYKEYGIVAVDANMDEYSDLENDGPFGYGPDVLYQANDRLMRYVLGRHIQPIPVEKLDCFSEIDDVAFDAYRKDVDGTVYTFGVPVNIQGPLLYYRKDLIPENYKEEWDDNNNDVPDMLESWNALYRFSLQRKGEDKFGYMKSVSDPYFAVGYLYSYGAYSFGDNNTNAEDIGYSKGDAVKGANVIRQLAGSMNEWCIDDTITVNSYSRIGNGDYFATMTTPDVYTMFIDEMVASGMTREEAVENLGVTYIPALPERGDITEENPTLIPSKMMGGVNGYAISAYTKCPNASLAFVDFATNYEMIKLRNELLGIAPAREDVAEEAGGISAVIYDNFAAGNVVVMPSIPENAQMWTPLSTFFADLAKDPYRPEEEMKYRTKEEMQGALENVDRQIYDAIFTLQGVD